MDQVPRGAGGRCAVAGAGTRLHTCHNGPITGYMESQHRKHHGKTSGLYDCSVGKVSFLSEVDSILSSRSLAIGTFQVY